MTVKRVCLRCGSDSFVSDRSLGGKIVCSKCGSSSLRKKSSFFFNRKIFIYIAIGIVIFLFII